MEKHNQMTLLNNGESQELNHLLSIVVSHT